MDNSTRTLRKMPARSAKSAERSSSRGRTAVTRETVVNRKSPSRRRSRSRSSARKKAEKVKDVREVKEKEVVLERLRTRSSRTAIEDVDPITNIVSRLKEGIDQVRNSLSPEVENLVRRSVSKFDQKTSVVVNNIVTRRTSSRLSRASSISAANTGSAVPFETTFEETLVREKTPIVTNHIGSTKEEKPVFARGNKNISNYLKVCGLVVLGAAICALVVAAHIVCNKDDCRLLISSLPKALDYSQYFDHYIWPAYSLSLILLYVGCFFFSPKQRRPNHFSPIGIAAAVLLVPSVWVCHYYYGGLRHLRFLQLIGATVAHNLVLNALAGSFSSLGSNVQLEYIIQLSSSIIMVLLNASVAATESARNSANPAVLLLTALQASVGIDHLVLPPLALGLGPVSLLWISLRPYILLLPQIYISANNLTVGSYSIIGLTIFHFVGYVFYRYCSTVKNIFLRDPYSKRFSNSTICGDYNEGVWGVVRHPQLLGLLLCEQAWTSFIVPSHLSAVLAPLSLLSASLLAQSADRRLSRTYRSVVTSPVIPFVPF